MSTTSQFQVKRDYYDSIDECLVEEKKNYNTNPRYKFFNQTHFTAGDIEQFEQYRDKTNSIINKYIDLDKNIFVDEKLYDFSWHKYKNIEPKSVENTFNYMFYKFKKGIFIKIIDNEMRVFLPFSNKNFTNEWGKLISIDPKYKSTEDFFRYIQEGENRRFNTKSINTFTDTWYGNNCLLRWEFPINEGDTGISNFSDMFKTLCKERKIDDIELFLNRRDFPLIKKDETEPYDHIFGNNTKLLSHNYKKYSPILSMVGSENFADIPIPTSEDWARVCSYENKFFQKYTNRDYKPKLTPWKDRKPTAIFRGSSTGAGVTIETNMRLKVSFLSTITPKDTDGLPLLDAGITDWKLRPRKIRGEKYLQTIDIKSLPYNLTNKLSISDQTSYKYIINIDGHVSAFRLGLELNSGFCVLLVESKYRLWYRHLLKEYEHYVPVKSDLSDLIEKIKWCKNNDKKCEEIAKNAKIFSEKYLSKDGILDYLQKLFYELKRFNGNYFYNFISPNKVIEKKEFNMLRKEFYYPYIQREIGINSLLSNQPNNYGFNKGIEWIFNYLKCKNAYDTYIFRDKEIFRNKNTVINKCTLKGLIYVEKISKKLVHEAFITKFGTNELSKIIPNFCFTYGHYGDCILSEYVDGCTLIEFIKSEHFSMDVFFYILIQISLAIKIAQDKCLFVHNDLTPWNIIIKKLKEPITIDYPIDVDNIFSIKTIFIPVIVDMGRSQIVYKNFTYSFYEYNFTKVQDILTLFNTCIYEISNINLSERDVDKLINLANYVSRTKYRDKVFRKTGKNGLGDIRYFFGKVKKYTNILSKNNYELEERDPIHFVHYICKSFNIKLTINKIIKNKPITSSPLQVFSFFFSKDKEEQIQTYLDSLGRLTMIDTPILRYDFQKKYFSTEILELFDNTVEQFNDFSKSIDEQDNKYKSLIKKFRSRLDISLKNISCNDEKIYVQNIEHTDFTFDKDIFLYPERVYEKLLSLSQSLSDINRENHDTISTIKTCLINGYITNDTDYYNILNNSNVLEKILINTFVYISYKIFSKTIQNLHDNKEEEYYKWSVKIVEKIKTLK